MTYKYKRLRRIYLCLFLTAALTVWSCVSFARGTDWEPSRAAFEAAYWSRARGDLCDRDGNVLVYTAEKEITRRVKNKEVSKKAYVRCYENAGNENAEALGHILFPMKEVEAKNDSSVKSDIPQTKLAGIAEQNLGQWLLTGDDTTADKGGSVWLTLDSGLQKYCYDTLVDFGCQYGAVTVIDIQTGEILALTDVPSYDYAALENAATVEEYEAALPYSSLVPFSLKGQTPGSVFKLISASVLCDAGRTYDVVNDTGVFQYNGHEIGNASGVKPDKTRDMVKAIGYSANVSFCLYAQDTDRDFVNREYSEKWYLNQTISLDFADISQSFCIDNDQLYYDTSYGMGELLVSPLYTCMSTAAVADDNGDFFKPYLCKKFLNAKGEEVSYKKATGGMKQREILTKRAVSQEAQTVIRDGMKLCAKNLHMKNCAVKTGTAEADKSNIYMTGYAPVDEPRYAITIAALQVKKGAHGKDLAKSFQGIVDELLN